ncbi:hypothetical protein BGZ98_008202 [Dissophora globulifera]|nr:hypothetical protein BGZ98_008202 [Dissophora globulifera]
MSRGNFLEYEIADVLNSLGLTRPQLTTLCCVLKNDYNSNIKLLGSVTNYDIAKSLQGDDPETIVRNYVYATVDRWTAHQFAGCESACDKIILPQTEAEILDFMKNDMHRLFNLLVLYDLYSKEAFVKKAEYERQLRRSNKVVSPVSPEEKECKDLEWDLLVLNSPAKQVGGRKSIMHQLKDDGEEDFAPNSPSNRKFAALKSIGVEGSTTPRLLSRQGRLKTFVERLKNAADDEEDEFAESYIC